MSGYAIVYQSEFESWLTDIKDELRPKLDYWRSVTDHLNHLQAGKGPQIKEAIYDIDTANRALIIRIYSSILEREETSRRMGTDRVRIILRWKTKNGVLFYNYKELNRVSGLQVNLTKALSEIANNLYDLNKLGPWACEDGPNHEDE